MKTNLKFFLILLFIGYIMEGRYSTFLHWRMIKRKKICLLTILSVHLRYASGSNKAGSVARSLQQLFAPAPAPPLPAPGDCIKAAGRGDTSPSHGSPAPGCAAPAANQRRTTSPSDQWAAGEMSSYGSRLLRQLGSRAAAPAPAPETGRSQRMVGNFQHIQ